MKNRYYLVTENPSLNCGDGPIVQKVGGTIQELRFTANWLLFESKAPDSEYHGLNLKLVDWKLHRVADVDCAYQPKFFWGMFQRFPDEKAKVVGTYQEAITEYNFEYEV